MKDNYIFKHIDSKNASGTASEDFYISQNSGKRTSGLLELSMYVDSRWQNFSTDRECCGQTACIAMIISGKLLRDGTILEPGDVLIENCRDSKLLLSTLPGRELHRKVLIISRTPAWEMLGHLLFPDGTTILHNCGEKITNIFDRISGECQNSGDYKHLSIILFQLLQELNAMQRKPEYPESLFRALKFIKNNGYGLLNRADICRAAGVSDRQLNVLFRTYLHTSPGRYLIARRISFAQKLLNTGKFSVRETARMCGFNGSEFFIRVFRQYTGITPGKWFSCSKEREP